MMWLPSPGKESGQTHVCLAHLPRSITINDTVKLTDTGVYFGRFLMDLRELRIGHDGFTSELLQCCSRLLDVSPSIASIV